MTERLSMLGAWWHGMRLTQSVIIILSQAVACSPLLTQSVVVHTHTWTSIHIQKKTHGHDADEYWRSRLFGFVTHAESCHVRTLNNALSQKLMIFIPTPCLLALASHVCTACTPACSQPLTLSRLSLLLTRVGNLPLSIHPIVWHDGPDAINVCSLATHNNPEWCIVPAVVNAIVRKSLVTRKGPRQRFVMWQK